jgi:uncharacterized protein YggT (Ycf19 family)
VQDESHFEMSPSPASDVGAGSLPAQAFSPDTQFSLRELLLLTALVASAIVVFQTIGVFASGLVLMSIAWWRIPAGEANPLMQAVAYATASLAVTVVLAVICRVSPIIAIGACFFAPACGYLVGFHKGLLRDL